MNTIASFLENSAREHPGKQALVFGASRLTYKEVDELANKVRNHLCSNNGKQDRIVLLLDNSIEYIVAYFGILKSGCVCVPLDVGISDENLSRVIKAVSPRLVISKTPFHKKLATAKVSESVQYFDINELLDNNCEDRHRDVAGEDIATILFSSGTSGVPKGVILRHRNVVAATENIVQYLRINQHDVDVNALKLSHSFGLGNIHCYFRQGGTVILEKNFVNLKRFLQRIIDEKATSFSVTPYVLRLLVEYCSGQLTECGKFLRYIVNNTNVLPKETSIPLLKLLPTTKVYTYYGLTEASRSSFHLLDKDDLLRLESAGKAAPNVEARVIDEHGKTISAGEVGEIIIGGSHVTNGYWENEQETKRVIKEGWLYTGDLGYFDPEGYLFICGRKDDVLNLRGEKVYPMEIEKVICKHEHVKDCAVIAVPDDLMERVVKAYVVIDPQYSEEIKAADIMNFCNKRLEAFKVPRSIEFCDDLPMTDSGKKKRGVLRMEDRE